MTPALIKKVKIWEPGKRMVFIPHKHKIKGKIIISKKGNIYYSYYKYRKYHNGT
uniref:Uncharacterized protein n=1 Tax=viral metagenome TaxID=1070528 RepID=A0A6M3LRD8_9ZZZZ